MQGVDFGAKSCVHSIIVSRESAAMGNAGPASHAGVVEMVRVLGRTCASAWRCAVVALAMAERLRKPRERMEEPTLVFRFPSQALSKASK